MENLNKSGLLPTLNQLVLNKKIPILGICLGMQLMTNHSEEGDCRGLGWIDASTIKFDFKEQNKLKIPHMGWNDVHPIGNNPLFHELETNSIFYFLHSYYFSCNNSQDVIAKSEYGLEFTCAVNHENIFGVQFHPEKSHRFGIQLLKNFAKL